MILEKGQTILNGKYTILKLLGEGGMARVWLARDEEFAGRLVAIKEPKSDLPSDELAELHRRFRQEVMVAKMLQDATAPNIVPVYTVERLNEKTPLLVMKYMAGSDLTRRIREYRRGMPVEDVVRIAADICRGLAVAHSDEVDIVHRDMKPSNVLFDQEGRAYVADFGLAQLSGMSSRSVGAGRPHPGTPMYMAPEQVRSPEPLTPAADVYALGCMLFEMLTGKRYKRVRPGTRVRELRTDVPQWLDEVVWRCVQEDPWDRYEDAGEVLAALEEGEKIEEQKARWAEIYEAGKTALEAGRWQEAVDALEALVAEAPDYKDAQVLLAQARTEQERERQQAAWLSHLERITSQNARRLKKVERLGLGDVRCVAYSPDSKWVAVGTSLGVELRNAATLRLVRTMEGHTGAVLSVTFSPDGSLLASGARGGTVRLWRVADGQLLRTLEGHTGRVWSVAFSPDGTLLASGADDATVRLWRVADGQLLRTLEGHTNWVKSVAFSPDGTLLASGSVDTTVRLWRVSNGTPVRILEGHTWIVGTVIFSSDGTLLASGSPQGVRLWRVADGSLVCTSKEHTWIVGTVTFSPNGTLLASGSWDTTVRLWRVSNGTPVRILEGHAWPVWSVAFSPDGTLLASGADDATVRLWRVADGQLLRTLEGHTGGVWSVALFAGRDAAGLGVS